MSIEQRLEPENPEDAIPRFRFSLFGLGFLLAANTVFFKALDLFQRDAGASILPDPGMAAFLGCGCATAIVLTVALKEGRALPSRSLIVASSIYILSMACTALHCAIPESPIWLHVAAGSFLGISDTVLFLLWGRALSNLPPKKALIHLAVSVGVGGAAGTMLSMLLAIVAALTCGALLGFVSFALLNRELSATAPEQPVNHSELAIRYHEAAGFLWKPVVASMACSFITGLTWSADLDSLGDGSLVIVSNLAVCFALIVFVYLPKRPFNLVAFFQLFLPIAAIVLLVIPFLDAPAGSLFSAAVQIANGCGFALLDIAVLSALAIASYVLAIPSGPLFGIQRAIGSGAMLAGLLAQFLVPQSTLKTLCALVLACYIAAIVVSTVRYGNKPLGERQEKEAVSIRKRCNVLADRYGLSPRETEILAYLGRGRGSNYISEELFISVHTVKTHTKHIHEKLDVHSREELINLIDESDVGADSDPDNKSES